MDDVAGARAPDVVGDPHPGSDGRSRRLGRSWSPGARHRRRRTRAVPSSPRSSPGPGCCRSGSPRPASSPSPIWPWPATSSTRSSYSRISLCWAIMFVILSVIYRPIEQLLSRTIADRRARGQRAAQPPRPGGHPVRLRARLPDRRAGAAPADRAGHVRRLERAVLDPRGRRAGLRGQLFRPRLAGRPSALRALRRARLPRVHLALSVRARRGGGDRLGPGRGRAGHGRGAVCLPVRHPLRLRPPPCRPAARRHARFPPSTPPARAPPTPSSRRRPPPGRGSGHGQAVPAPRRRVRGRGGGDHALRAGPDERRRADRGRQGGGSLAHRRADRFRVQRDADRACAAAALPGHPDLDPPPPGRPRGPRERRRVPPRDPDHDPGHHRLSGWPWRSGCCSSGRR